MVLFRALLLVICEYVKSFMKFINVDKYEFEEENVKRELQFPNYLMILPERIINYIASIGLTLKPDILTNIDILDIEPKKILNPLSTSNIKYNTEYVVKKTKIPSIMVLNKNHTSVIYRLPYMTKVEKANLANVEKFVETFSVIL